MNGNSKLYISVKDGKPKAVKASTVFETYNDNIKSGGSGDVKVLGYNILRKRFDMIIPSRFGPIKGQKGSLKLTLDTSNIENFKKKSVDVFVASGARLLVSSNNTPTTIQALNMKNSRSSRMLVGFTTSPTSEAINFVECTAIESFDSGEAEVYNTEVGQNMIYCDGVWVR